MERTTPHVRNCRGKGSCKDLRLEECRQKLISHTEKHNGQGNLGMKGEPGEGHAHNGRGNTTCVEKGMGFQLGMKTHWQSPYTELDLHPGHRGGRNLEQRDVQTVSTTGKGKKSRIAARNGHTVKLCF